MKQLVVPFMLVLGMVITVFTFDVSGWIDSQNVVKLKGENNSALISNDEVHVKKDNDEGSGSESEIDDTLNEDSDVNSISPPLSDSNDVGITNENDDLVDIEDVEQPNYEEDISSGVLDEDKDEDGSTDTQGALNTKGKVKATWISTTDGDTIKVQFGKTENGKETKVTETIRMLLVDTPESVHAEKEIQAYGVQASRYTKSVGRENKEVYIELGNPQRDEYDRILAYVWLQDGTMLNEDLVSKGYARVGYIYPPNIKYLDELKEAQKQAKSEKLRIWSINNYVTDRGFNMEVVTDKDLMKIKN